MYVEDSKKTDKGWPRCSSDGHVINFVTNANQAYIYKHRIECFRHEYLLDSFEIYWFIKWRLGNGVEVTRVRFVNNGALVLFDPRDTRQWWLILW